MRYRPRTDANQPDIVKGLRDAGYTVWITSALGTGVDIVAGKNGVNFMLEIKDPSKVPSQRRLTDDEAAFHAAWCGQIAVVETLEASLEVCQE